MRHDDINPNKDIIKNPTCGGREMWVIEMLGMQNSEQQIICMQKLEQQIRRTHKA